MCDRVEHARTPGLPTLASETASAAGVALNSQAQVSRLAAASVQPDARADLPTASIMQSVTIPLPNGAMPRLTVFRGLVDGDTDHFALTFENRSKGTDRESTPLRTDLLAGVAQVRLHSSCLTGDMLGSMRCDCGPQLDDAIARFSRDGGTIIYLQQEGRGIGLAQKIAAYGVQDQGANTFEANRRLGFADDLRDYRVAAQMLLALGLGSIRLVTNNPDKVAQLGRWGIKVVVVEPTLVSLNEHNRRYLVAKRDLAGHRLSLGTNAAHGDER